MAAADNDDDDDNGMLWVAIGVLLGVLGVGLLVVVAVVQFAPLLVHHRFHHGVGPELAWTRPKPDGFEVGRDRLVVGEKIGSGEFGIVSVGRLTNKRG